MPDELAARWVDEYSPALLKWAWGKTGDRIRAEDLTQEVWLQFFCAVRKEEQCAHPIAQPEHPPHRVHRL